MHDAFFCDGVLLGIIVSGLSLIDRFDDRCPVFRCRADQGCACFLFLRVVLGIV